MADDAQALTTKQAELKAAELSLAAEKATAEGEKASLLEQKAAAEAEARAAAVAEAAYKEKRASQQQSVLASANTNLTAQVQAVSESAAAPVRAKVRPTYSTNASSYPIGECTWGVKHWHLGLETTGVMEHSGLQVQQQQVSVQVQHLKLEQLHVGMMVDMVT